VAMNQSFNLAWVSIFSNLRECRSFQTCALFYWSRMKTTCFWPEFLSLWMWSPSWVIMLVWSSSTSCRHWRISAKL
jgi:hypothetical protein